jgi:hypothetical protein
VAVASRKAGKKKQELPPRVDDLYGGGYSGDWLQGKYHTELVYAWFQKRHEKGLKFIDEDGYYRRADQNGRTHEWKVPLGVRVMLHTRLLPTQVSAKYPFKVTWRSSKTGQRFYKKMQSLPHAIIFVAEKAQYVDPHATIINRIGMDIPPQLRNKLPPPWKWCPCCMKPRKFKRQYESTGDPKTFHASVKVWHSVFKKKRVGKKVVMADVGYYQSVERKLALMACPVCGLTNRDDKFRRSNQPWERKKIKQGKTRLKRRKQR